MRYDSESLRRLEYVLAVFKRYIEANPRLDIVLSEKAGFIRLGISGERLTAGRIANADDLIGVILEEIVYDSVLSPGYTGFVPDCEEPFERAKRILYSYADADEATLEKLRTALVFMMKPYCTGRNT